MLAHGEDINAGFPRNHVLRMVTRCAVDDDTTFGRIRFLVLRGTRIARSGALREVTAVWAAALSSRRVC